MAHSGNQHSTDTYFPCVTALVQLLPPSKRFLPLINLPFDHIPPLLTCLAGVLAVTLESTSLQSGESQANANIGFDLSIEEEASVKMGPGAGFISRTKSARKVSSEERAEVDTYHILLWIWIKLRPSRTASLVTAFLIFFVFLWLPFCLLYQGETLYLFLKDVSASSVATLRCTAAYTGYVGAFLGLVTWQSPMTGTIPLQKLLVSR